MGHLATAARPIARSKSGAAAINYGSAVQTQRGWQLGGIDGGLWFKVAATTVHTAEIAAAQLTIDGGVEQGKLAGAALVLKAVADRPDLLLLEW